MTKSLRATPLALLIGLGLLGVSGCASQKATKTTDSGLRRQPGEEILGLHIPCAACKLDLNTMNQLVKLTDGYERKDMTVTVLDKQKAVLCEKDVPGLFTQEAKYSEIECGEFDKKAVTSVQLKWATKKDPGGEWKSDGATTASEFCLNDCEPTS